MNREKQDRVIRDWLYAGPFDRDVSDLYHDNYVVPVEPYLPFMTEAEQAASGMQPQEGKEVTLFGETLSWRLLRTELTESKMTWARFGVHARLLTTFAYARLHADEAGIYNFHLWLAGSARFYVNGNKQFEFNGVGRLSGDFDLELTLEAGENELIMVLSNVHLHCMNSFTLVMNSDRVKTSLPLLLNPEDRRQLERELRGFYMKQGTYSGDETVELEWEGPVLSRGLFHITVYRSTRGMAKEEVHRLSAPIHGDMGTIAVIGANQLPEAGEYVLFVDYEGEQGERIGGITLGFKRIDWLAALPEAGYDVRKAYMLQQFAQSNCDVRSVIHRELAKMEAGLWEKVEPEAIDQALQYINDRYDCADFAMHGLLRMYIRHSGSGRIPEPLKQRMKACILGFKYWVDEPGRSMMFTRSENHEILFHSAEYVAGLLFPGELFTSSGQNGLFHALKGQLKSERWIKEKGTYGYMEWHSNTYYEEDILALLNIYDFGEENAYIRILARQLLDLTVAIMASHSFRGVMATTHGRSYEESIIHPELESMSHLNWLLFGQPKRLASKLSIGCVALASSTYAPHPDWAFVAADEEELYTRTRMGLFPNRGLGGVNCATYRTKDYMVSGMVGSKKGELGHQVHAGQVLLDGTVPVFVTCFDNKSEMTRPSYWGGQYRNPNTIAYKQLLAYMYRLEGGPGYTHCYFPLERFDETAERGGWLFGCKGEAYVAVYSQHPYTRTLSGKYKNCELLCMEKNNIWLLEAGSRQQSGGFEQFVEAIASAKLTHVGEELHYVSPSLGEVRLGYDSTCTVTGKAVPDGDYPLIGNKFASGEYGAGITRLKTKDGTSILNFLI